MSDTRRKGDVSLSMVVAAFVAKNFKVSLPYSDNTRYDLVVDDGASLRRIQVKTGRIKSNETVICFHACSSVAHHFYKGKPGPKTFAYHGQIEAFAVYVPVLRAVYLVPIEKAPSKSAMDLRLAPSKNGQKKRINMAADFEFYRF